MIDPRNLSYLLLHEFRWLNNATLSYQKFDNFNFGKNWPTYIVMLVGYFTQQYSRSLMGNFNYDTTFYLCKRKLPALLFPSRTKEKACTLLLLTNIAYPEWINVECQEPLTKYAICSSRKTRTNHTVEKKCSQILPIFYDLEKYHLFQDCLERLHKDQDGSMRIVIHAKS